MAGRIGCAVAAALMSLTCSVAAEASCSPPRPVRFAPGSVSAELSGGVPRGERDCFSISAGQGQHLAVSQVNPVDDNIVIQLYRPPWKISTGEDGLSVAGGALPGAGDGDDAAKWSGALPVRGTYLLVVGTSRGSGEYHLRVEIR
jgi:hypothetical protein